MMIFSPFLEIFLLEALVWHYSQPYESVLDLPRLTIRYYFFFLTLNFIAAQIIWNLSFLVNRIFVLFHSLKRAHVLRFKFLIVSHRIENARSHLKTKCFPSTSINSFRRCNFSSIHSRKLY